jgi:large subunit ribosomal protein L23
MRDVITPRISEKGYALATKNNVYVFNVPKITNKIDVKKAVEKLYNVKVTDVNILNVAGKVKRSVKKGGRQSLGKRSDYKKAYVTLKAGQSIPVYATEEAAKAEKTGKVDKKDKK